MRDTRRGRIAHRVCAHGPVNWLRRHDLDGLRTAARCSVVAARYSLLAAHCSLLTAHPVVVVSFRALLPSWPLCHLPSLPPACRTQLFNGVENSIVIGSGYSAATVLSIASSVRACTGRKGARGAGPVFCLCGRQSSDRLPRCQAGVGVPRRRIKAVGLPAPCCWHEWHAGASYAHHSLRTPQLQHTAAA